MGSRIPFQAGALAIFFRFCQSFTSNFPFPFSFPFLPPPPPFPLPSTFRLRCKTHSSHLLVPLTIFSVRAWCHNGDRDRSPERSGLVSCLHWMMPMLWSGGRADKISNKLAYDVACHSGSMVEHQTRLLGSRIRFPAGAYAIFSRFCQSFPSNFPFPLSFPDPFLYPFPLPLLSTFRLHYKTHSSSLSH